MEWSGIPAKKNAPKIFLPLPQPISETGDQQKGENKSAGEKRTHLINFDKIFNGDYFQKSGTTETGAIRWGKKGQNLTGKKGSQIWPILTKFLLLKIFWGSFNNNKNHSKFSILDSVSRPKIFPKKI